MELVNTNDENSFDPTPRLKSSPIPIKFLSFNQADRKCFNCGEEYIEAALCRRQKYCKKCLSRYINDITDNDNTYLDVYIYTMDLECSNHEISRTIVPQNIQECCGNCVRILCFKQMAGLIGYYSNENTLYDIRNKVIESECYCKLCRKPLSLTYIVFDDLSLCSDCYLISSEWIESTLVKKRILILYLPWWHDNLSCNACYSKLTFTSDCQKYCANCCIFYVGCRYCLTTNIIFGPILESKCKKCKRISLIINSSEYSDIDDFLFNNVLHGDFELPDTVYIVKNIGENFNIRDILNTLFKTRKSKSQINWTPYSQFEDVKEMTKGGYGIIHKATWLSNNETVILKRFENSKNSSNYFLNELKSYRHCIDKSLYKRPEITEDTPECYANLMKSCWDHDPKKRPSIKVIRNTFGSWAFRGKNKAEFEQAEAKRKKLIELKKIGPEFAEKYHSEAIYTSRLLSDIISKCSSTNSFSTISYGNKQDSNYISEELELDIDTESLSSQNLSIKTQNSLKRNIEELNFETDDDNVEKRIKTR
ncbi:hypothetical protein RhiirA1_542179 [Rhizophagus irregularis]|uniref:Protein kinase domain-containing protein n=1 Tax=Rhizophagus irregularis TaxID=588596 RepID=A0A2N0QZ08_9GLOM|nr:hypothetical protein RhiirA1_542179 [Rhizophagus irregularis]